MNVKRKGLRCRTEITLKLRYVKPERMSTKRVSLGFAIASSVTGNFDGTKDGRAEFEAQVRKASKMDA